jgi:HlyD family secretion protein
MAQILYKPEIEESEGNGKLEIRSEEVQDILSYIPHWIIRWGISVIALAVLMLLLVSWLIKYPDIITARVTILTQSPPVKVIARTSGKLDRLFVQDNELVSQGTYLAVIENTANLDDVTAFKEQLHQLEVLFDEPNKLLAIEMNPFVEMGEMQDAYSTLRQTMQAFKFLQQSDYHVNKIHSIQAQIDSHRELDSRLHNQKAIITQELALATDKHKKSQTLYEKGLISEVELSNVEETYLQKKYALESAESAMVNNRLQITEYEKTILDLRHEFQERRREVLLDLHEAFMALQTAFATWEQRYVLKAPISGQVSFFRYWSDQQFVTSGEEVMTIVPDSQELVGKIELPGAGAGKVKAGQTVRIKLDSYPFSEFGALEGEVAAISLVARDNLELITVALPKGLRTNYRKDLSFKQGMQGTAEIVTENLRIFERVFNQLRAIITA